MSALEHYLAIFRQWRRRHYPGAGADPASLSTKSLSRQLHYASERMIFETARTHNAVSRQGLATAIYAKYANEVAHRGSR